MALRRPKRYSASRRRGTGRGTGGAMFDRFGLPIPGAAAGIVPPGLGGSAQGIPAPPPGNTGLGTPAPGPTPPPPLPTRPSGVLAPAPGGVPAPAPTPELSPTPLSNPILDGALADPMLTQASGTGGSSQLDAGMVDLGAPLPSDIAQSQTLGPQPDGTVATGGDTGNDDWRTQTPEVVTPGASWPFGDVGGQQPASNVYASAPTPTPRAGADSVSSPFGDVGGQMPAPNVYSSAPTPAPVAAPAPVARSGPDSVSSPFGDAGGQMAAPNVYSSAPPPAPVSQPLVYSPTMGWVTVAQLFAGYQPPAPTPAPTTDLTQREGERSRAIATDTNPYVAPGTPEGFGEPAGSTVFNVPAPQKTAEEWMRELGGSNALVFDHGGVINETVWGIGESGKKYVFAANGKPERVTPMKGGQPAPRARSF